VEFHELLAKRRAIRRYTGEPVPRETLERIVRATRRAPSAGYSQGQRLLVVDDPGLLADLAALAGGPDDPELEPWFPSAPAHVFVLTREADYHDRYRSEDKLREGKEIEWPVPFWYVDAGATLMLVLLTAVDEGLSAGVYGVPVEQDPAFRALLGIPEDIHIVAGVTIGRGAPDPGWSGKTSRATQRRRSLDELVRWNGW
jgi:nitroreductase